MAASAYPTQAPWAFVTVTAWVLCGVYFVASAFSTQQIRLREAGRERRRDSFFLWSGYILLFFETKHAGLWNRFFLPPSARLPLGWTGASLAVAGLAFTLWSRITLGQYWSRIVALKVDHRLVRSGPYHAIRHPLYSGLILAALGTVLAFGVWRCMLGAALLWYGFYSRARREDALLAQQFGDEFAQYRSQTGRLLPRFH